MAIGPPPDVPLTKCRRCPAQIFFVLSEKGRPIPMDAEPVQGFTLEKRKPGADGLHYPHYVAHHARVYISHFATCPEAASFRRDG